LNDSKTKNIFVYTFHFGSVITSNRDYGRVYFCKEKYCS